MASLAWGDRVPASKEAGRSFDDTRGEAALWRQVMEEEEDEGEDDEEESPPPEDPVGEAEDAGNGSAEAAVPTRAATAAAQSEREAISRRSKPFAKPDKSTSLRRPPRSCSR